MLHSWQVIVDILEENFKDIIIFIGIKKPLEFKSTNL